jgi:hypothetical protein
MADSHQNSLQILIQQLQSARSHDDAVRSHNAGGQTLHVPGAGKAISSAYEQLRKAAEYDEEHLVLQHAIRRFYNRTLFLGRRPKDIGHELIVELTQAGYLYEGEFSSETAHTITELANEYVHVHGRLRQAHVPNNKALDWVLSVMSVKTENLLNPHSNHGVMANFAYQYFLQALPREQMTRSREEDQIYEISLYVAVHQALLKSDIDVVRTDILNLYQVSSDDVHNYKAWNERVHDIYLSNFTQRLKRVVTKNGAPFRVLRSMSDDSPDLPDLLPHREQFLDAYGYQINKEYKRVSHRLNNGIIKSIIFILITKTIIGLGIEVPFDLLVYGYVAMVPLIINLLFPPLYMASIRLGITMPSRANAERTKAYIDQLLYGDGRPPLTVGEQNKSYSAAAKVAYTFLFLLPIGLTVFILERLEFNPLQMIIFFVFFSTASFLGFRLRTMVRELKMSSQQSSFRSLIVDFFYLPFIILGQWLSSKYAKINLVAKFLDIAIEMPLKTLLRLIRQWMRFLNEKHEEIY